MARTGTTAARRRSGTGAAARVATALAACAVLVSLSACAAAGNAEATPQADAGFWLGLWHGLIAPIAFVVSLFTDDVGIYEVRNSGAWYDAGFVLGLAIAFSGSAGSGAAAGRRR